jgi:4'-phosphopantetheinyl transferase
VTDRSVLSPGVVAVHWARLEDFAPGEIEARSDLLSPGERARVSRFVFEADRRLALLTRVMARQVVGAAAGLPPSELIFQSTAHGRPLLANGGFDWLTFNLSHSKGLVICALACRADLGVDVEAIRGPAPLDVADRFFAPREAHALRQLDDADQRRRFFELWTLKEAYIKARGLGLSIPLDSFSYDLQAGSIRITFGPAAQETAEQWRFQLTDLKPEHLFAVALRPGVNVPLRTQVHRFGPVRGR